MTTQEANLVPAKRTSAGALYEAPTNQSFTVREGQIVELSPVDEYAIAAYGRNPSTTDLDLVAITGVPRHYVVPANQTELKVTSEGEVFVLIY